MRTPSMASSASTPARSLRWSQTLRGRSQVLIRTIVPQDRAAERAFLETLSSEARCFRFFGQVRSPSEQLIDRLTDLDPHSEAAFVAVIPEGSAERIVGAARYGASVDGAACECAVTVIDEWQNKGLGGALMKHLIELARERGIHRMYSVDLAENLQMRDLARHLGFHVRVDPDDDRQVIHELSL
ncbi:GNAT family N-acetyltransferase [Lysobacter sp. Root667]|uniref:GNAT family N-acetyltransferase n=1 Tax=Lysobacter sp. Root667 TaxID=1736581 RepID=UPI000AD5409A|nr:GNAT family N-acetyltransferase [Lysobacter sp. Root667]